jgi:sulfur carrier protein ThiS adenylyltransferase
LIRSGVNADQHAQLKIGIAGMGGIGSNVAWNLVRAGAAHLRIIDFDVVERSNLDRQFYFESQIGQPKVEASRENLLKIASACQIEVINDTLTADNVYDYFKDMDVLIEGFDNPACKAFLVERFLGEPIHLVSACGVAGNDIETVRVKKISNCFLVGDFTTNVTRCDSYSFSPKVNLVAALMAGIALNGDYKVV